MSLAQLLYQRQLAHGTLASAIEHTGIFSWDRYGRFRQKQSVLPLAKKMQSYAAFIKPEQVEKATTGTWP